MELYSGEKNLEGYVTLHGQVKGEQKTKILEESHIFVLPTEYQAEGQPISIIEAMAYGMPVIATRWRGIIEQVIDSKTGYYVEYQNPLDIANRVENVISDNSHFSELCKNAYEHYSKSFTREAHIRNMIALFDCSFSK